MPIARWCSVADRYRIIYADPPWAFRAWTGDTLASRKAGAAGAHYPTMKDDDIAALPVADWCEKDAALFIWITNPNIPLAVRIVEAWGFTFKTVAFAWVKIKGKQDRLFYAGEDVRLGLGYHTRSGFEQCWLATRGHGYERLTKAEPQVVFSPLREHSRKPDEIADAIVRLCGDLPRLEMFARTQRPGWQAWGNQTDKFSGAA